MLIPKIITVFVTLLFSLFVFSVIYYIFYNFLPKADISIRYILEEELPFSVHLCHIILNSNEIREILFNIIAGNSLEKNKNILLDKIHFLLEKEDFEITIDNQIFRRGMGVLKEIYSCYFIFQDKVYEIKIKI